MRIAFIVSLTYLLFSSNPSLGQFTVSGLKGMVSVPFASTVEDSKIMMGAQSNAFKYRLVPDGNRRMGIQGGEMVYSLSLGFVSRLNVILNLTRINNSRSVNGIGDRDGQFTYLVMKEKKILPAVAINLSFPAFSDQQYLAGNHIVATKRYLISSLFEVIGSLGYGLPYIYGSSREDSSVLFQRKQTDFLSGLFGGLNLAYKDTVNISLEHDGRTWNAGLSGKLISRLYIDFFVQGFDRLGLGINYVSTIN